MTAEPDDTPNLVAMCPQRDKVTSFVHDAEGRRIDNPKHDPPDDAPDEPHIVG